MLEGVGLLGDNLPAHVAAFMNVLTGIRVDVVRFGRGEFDNNMSGAAKIIQEDLKLWEEFEPQARLLVRDLRIMPTRLSVSSGCSECTQIESISPRSRLVVDDAYGAVATPSSLSDGTIRGVRQQP
jgi:hypothetical protein